MALLHTCAWMRKINRKTGEKKRRRRRRRRKATEDKRKNCHTHIRIVLLFLFRCRGNICDCHVCTDCAWTLFAHQHSYFSYILQKKIKYKRKILFTIWFGVCVCEAGWLQFTFVWFRFFSFFHLSEAQWYGFVGDEVLMVRRCQQSCSKFRYNISMLCVRTANRITSISFHLPHRSLSFPLVCFKFSFSYVYGQIQCWFRTNLTHNLHWASFFFSLPDLLFLSTVVRFFLTVLYILTLTRVRFQL